VEWEAKSGRVGVYDMVGMDVYIWLVVELTLVTNDRNLLFYISNIFIATTHAPV